MTRSVGSEMIVARQDFGCVTSIRDFEDIPASG